MVKPMANLTRDERGQGFTLEGLIGGLLILAAVLFALQATILAPNASGSTSEKTQLALQRQADDILTTTATDEEKSLSYYVRYWDMGRLTFVEGKNLEVGYGSRRVPGPFGERLETVFTENGHTYNVILAYQTDGSEQNDTIPMVYQGEPPSSAVVATYKVTLYDSMSLKGPEAPIAGLDEFDTEPYDGDDGYYPVPEAAPNSTVYNVVEVRLIVW